MIIVRRSAGDKPFRFDVTVQEGAGETRHEVTLSDALYRKLAVAAQSPEQVIEAAFRFLLDREPKEAILAHFDVSVISRYFPEFEEILPHYLAA